MNPFQKARHYASKADHVFGVSRSIERFKELKPATTTSRQEMLQGLGIARRRDVPDGLGTLAGGVAGIAVFRGSHPFLGAVGGASLGRNVPALFRPELRARAMQNLASTGGGVLGSLLWKDHPRLGFLAGWLAANLLVNTADE